MFLTLLTRLLRREDAQVSLYLVCSAYMSAAASLCTLCSLDTAYQPRALRWTVPANLPSPALDLGGVWCHTPYLWAT